MSQKTTYWKILVQKRQNEMKRKRKIDTASIVQSELENELDKSLAEEELRELEGILIKGDKKNSVSKEIYRDDKGKFNPKKDDRRNDYENAWNSEIQVTDLNKRDSVEERDRRAWKKHDVLMMKIIMGCEGKKGPSCEKEKRHKKENCEKIIESK